MATMFTDLPVRSNADRILRDWFNAIRTAGISLQELAALAVERTQQTLTEGASNTNITGLLFSGVTYRAVYIDYFIYRVSTGGSATEKTEAGTIILTYKTVANAWTLTVTPSVGGEDSGVTFSVTSAGQVRYSADTLAGTSPVSKIVYIARALTKET